MRTRIDLLEHLVAFDEPLAQLTSQLDRYGWDCEEPLMVLEPRHVIAILRRYLGGELRSADVESWANALELRDDIDDQTGDAIFLLANPDINWPISTESVTLLLGKLEAFGASHHSAYRSAWVNGGSSRNST